MKNTVLPISLSLLLLLAGCCKQYDCYYSHSVSVYFWSYQPDELDSLVITGYKKGDNEFSEISVPEYIDAVSTEELFTDDENGPAYRYLLNTGHDWEIFLPSDNRRFRIHDYTFTEVSCKVNCGFKKEKYPTLTSFKANDKIIEGEYLTIVKGEE